MHSSGYVRLQGTMVFNKSMLFKRKAVLIEGLNEQQVREEEENSWTFNQPPSTCSPHTQGFYVNWKPLFLQCLQKNHTWCLNLDSIFVFNLETTTILDYTMTMLVGDAFAVFQFFLC